MSGKVYLVGAGPGDYKLMTLKGEACLKQADVIIYDRLVSAEYLALTKPSCECINVGKASSKHTMPQDEINKLLVRKAKEGKYVVRLKGGDPYVFGRGGEEGAYLFEHQIDFEVVPGITSVIGGLCYAGIPITHRDEASSFHVMTGHLKEQMSAEINWKALVELKGTLVFVMGLSNLKKIVSELMKAGKSELTPVALISYATCSNQQVITGTLQSIGDIAEKAKMSSPVLIVVGAVVNLREKLSFFEKKPLFGKNIVVTRSRQQSGALVDLIRDLGGMPIQFPTITTERILPQGALKEAIKHLEDYTYVVFTSQNAIEIFFDTLDESGLDARVLGKVKIAVVGPATRRALKEKGLMADFMPKEANQEALGQLLKQYLTPKDKVLLPQSILAREDLHTCLETICPVNSIAIYNTVTGSSREPIGALITAAQLLEALRDKQIDFITFTSSSTVKNFVEKIGEENLGLLSEAKLVSIGEMTSKTLLAYGLKLYKQATKASMEELVACMYEGDE